MRGAHITSTASTSQDPKSRAFRSEAFGRLSLFGKKTEYLLLPPGINDRQLLGPFSKHVCVCSICPKEGSHFLSFYFHLFVFRVGHCLGNIQPLYWLPWNERLHSWLGFMKRTRLFRDHPRGLKCTRGCVVAYIVSMVAPLFFCTRQ